MNTQEETKPAASLEVCPHLNYTIMVSWWQASSLQNSEGTNACCLSHSVHDNVAIIPQAKCHSAFTHCVSHNTVIANFALQQRLFSSSIYLPFSKTYLLRLWFSIIPYYLGELGCSLMFLPFSDKVFELLLECRVCFHLITIPTPLGSFLDHWVLWPELHIRVHFKPL